MLRIDNLTIKTRFTVLEKASFTFKKGEVYGIIAPNGSGKTTLFRAINHLIPSTNGNISIHNKPIQEVKKSLFYFESVEWFDTHMTGMDYLNLTKSEYTSNIKIQDAVSIFNIHEFVTLPIKKYSLGMKQKLLITMYVLSDAEYLIMDEITNGLDDHSRVVFMSLVASLHAQGKTLLISSHYKQDLEQMCTQFVELQDKKLVNI